MSNAEFIVSLKIDALVFFRQTVFLELFFLGLLDDVERSTDARRFDDVDAIAVAVVNFDAVVDLAITKSSPL